ncbi:7-deoxyloganetin glucosyltransferase-like [Silene latifolia]|uniref:7-deoxyloganetin glucosyltransferase-like n=1 Tax=Silene latifolia TaxID=37657 RepID=UPI003D781456
MEIIGSSKGHVICIPFPAQGHITPMLQFAKLLYSKGFNITFLNTIYNHNRFLKSLGQHSLDGLPGFHFESISDGLQLSPNDDATQDIPTLCRSMNSTCHDSFRDLIARLNEDGPPVTCIVSDGALYFAVEVAQEVGIPDVVFWTMSGCGFMGYVHFRTLVDRGLVPLLDATYLTNGYLDTQVELQGLRNVRLKDLPTFIRTTDPDDYMLNYMQKAVQISSQATAIFLNTFEALEEDVLNTLSTMEQFPPIYSVGSIDLLLDQLIPDVNNSAIRSICSSLWKEQPECMEWLDSKEPNSVVYVNFGSITVMSQEEFVEFAWGLANSKKYFLWVIRPDIVMGNSSITLPKEFVVETKDRGMLASWCPQKEVLKHESIGGFLTHSGWNSTLESICGGVPMLCWPFFAEQQTNCRYSCVDWGIGMEIESDVKRTAVERMVRVLMEESEGMEMRRRAKEWKCKAEDAAKPGGSSYKNFNKLVNEISLKD